MINNDEDSISIFQVKTNTSFNRLFRFYKSHIIYCITHQEPILSIEEWYWRAKAQKLIVSRNFEAYLRMTFNKVPTSSGVKLTDLK